MQCAMRLTPQELDIFAAACLRDVAPSRIEREVRIFGIVKDYETFVKEKSAGQVDPALALFRAILHEFNERKLACDLAESLFFEIAWSGDNRDKIAGFTRSVRTPGAPPNALQALLKQRDHFITDDRLSELFTRVRPRVGFVVGTFLDKTNRAVSPRATAFLVGPDLVLTALHTFDPLLAEGRSAEAPQWFKVVFDHRIGEAIESTADLVKLPHLRVVNLHPSNWLVKSSAAVQWAGTVELLSAVQCTELAGNLDFGLIRLEEPVGNLPVSAGSRERRGWLAVKQPTPFAYSFQTQVVMPQHPQGMSLRHAFGRILGTWDPTTRVIYELEAGKGSSGAPCLNGKMELIGIHSAAYEPGGKLKGNLAVRMDAIRPQLTAHLPAAPAAPAAKSIWRVPRPDNSFVPVLGRDKLQVWLDKATGAAVTNKSRSDRIYVADALQKGAGKSFTLEIVQTYLTSVASQTIIVFGGDTELIPERLEDFVIALATGFGISKADLGELPKRPGVSLPKEAKDGDKVDRWESQDMPEWFASRLAAHRVITVNKTEVLKRFVEDSVKLGRPVAPEDRDVANANPPVIIPSDRWSKTWILLDDLNKRPLSPEVRKFVAGLIGADIDENAVTDVRASLQWLFLGAVPEFLIPQDMTVEAFSPDTVPTEHIFATLQAAFDAADMKIDATPLASFVEIMLPQALQQESVERSPPATRLGVCQKLVASMIVGFYLKNGRKL
jgi:hypothetical protein